MTDATENAAATEGEGTQPAQGAEEALPQSDGATSESTVKDQISALASEKQRYKDKAKALEEENEVLKQKAMTAEEKVIEAAKAEGAAPYKQRLEDTETTLQSRLDQKLEGMTDEQRELVPEGLSVADRLVQADRVAAMNLGTTPTPASVGGAANPAATKARTFTHAEYQDIAQRAGDPDPLVREAAAGDWKDASAAYKHGRVGKKIIT